VRANRFAERRVFGQTGLAERLQVERDESLALLVGDPEAAVHIDEVVEAQLAREAVRAAERLSREPGQVLDVVRLPLPEQRLEQRIGENL
jgi:hypothetical protein